MKTSRNVSRASRKRALLSSLVAWTLFLSFWPATNTRGQMHTAGEEYYEGYYVFLDDFPADTGPGWSDEAQGLAHDENHWFITQTPGVFSKPGVLWKIPVTADLSEVQAGDPGVTTKRYEEVAELEMASLRHWGDLDYHEEGGRHYLFVGASDYPNPVAPCLVVFDADTLSYIAHTNWPGVSEEFGWCAVDPHGRCIYGGGAANYIRRWSLDWEPLRNKNTLVLTEIVPPLYLFDEGGNPRTLEGLDSGETSPSGELLYLGTGSESEGALVEVYDTSTGWRVAVSRSCDLGGGECGLDRFVYDKEGCCGNEMEGLTIWDLDPLGLANVVGQLHVIRLDNDVFGQDDVSIKHFGGTIYVDRVGAGTERGTFLLPFHSVSHALGGNAARDGIQMSIAGGCYAESVTFTHKMRVRSGGGLVQIGR